MSTAIKDEREAMKRPWPTTLEGKTKRLINGLTLPLVLLQERFTLSRASKVMTHSDYTADKLAVQLGIARDKIEVVPFAVDTERFRPWRSPESPVGDRYVLMVGRINDPRKNTGLLLRAFSTVQESGIATKLVLVGRRPLDGSLERMCYDLGIETVVSFAGELTTDELIRYYQNAELVVLPSRQEGFGIVVLEAFACGVPAVSTRCGGPEEIISDGETGLLVANDDANELAEAIIRVLGDDRLRQEMGREARLVACRDYSRSAVRERILEIGRDASR